ncbi:MAG: ATP-grasp domain-containing protein [Chloroflexi bacterium]|nr:ATP-grasp domain-containing protein [Chloroflexota bacterium]MCI0725594.1 ATP-grasp domain-containing protein [Chloroflexota bacterium]
MPLIDADLLILAEHQELFSEAGILTLISSLPVVQICRDKRLTAQFFTEHDIPTVRTLALDDLAPGRATYPLFIKPAVGSGSIKSFKINNAEELAFFLRYVPVPIVQEYARGQEYTVDVLMDLNGRVLNAVPRRRLEVRAGEISKGVTVKDWRIIEAVVSLLEKLGAIGPVTVQCFVSDEGIQFTEINPRVGGGLPLSIAAGADYPTQIVRMTLGESVEPCIGNFIDDFYMFRYEEAVYVPGEAVYRVPVRCSV